MSWPVPERRERLLALYRSGATFKQIAAEYGGTPQGVRSTIRKMKERDDPLQMPVTKAMREAGRIRHLRELGLKHHEIAERVGISERTVCRALSR
jgi:DNA-binding NarL/FixJ family response regulator